MVKIKHYQDSIRLYNQSNFDHSFFQKKVVQLNLWPGLPMDCPRIAYGLSASVMSGPTLMIMQLNNLTGLRWEIKYSGFGCIDYSWSFTQLFKVCFKRESRRKKKVGPYVGSLPIHFNSAWLNSRLLDLKINSGRTRTDRSRRICRLCQINADFRIFFKDFWEFVGFG